MEFTFTTALPSLNSSSIRLYPRTPTSGTQSHGSAQSQAGDLLTSAVLNLTNVIKTNQNDSNEIIIDVGEEFSTFLTTVSTAVQVLTDSVCPPEQKIRKTSTDLNSSLIHSHGFIIPICHFNFCMFPRTVISFATQNKGHPTAP